MDIHSTDEDLERFLPIMHCAVTNEENYLWDIERMPQESNYRELLVLSRRLGKGTDSIIGKNILVCAFTISSNDLIVDQNLIDELYGSVVNLLETYFNSPVLEKILEDRRRSEVLTYEHSLYNLRIDATLANLQKRIRHARVYGS